jgi:hypothetical protein
MTTGRPERLCWAVVVVVALSALDLTCCPAPSSTSASTPAATGTTIPYQAESSTSTTARQADARPPISSCSGALIPIASPSRTQGSIPCALPLPLPLFVQPAVGQLTRR